MNDMGKPTRAWPALEKAIYEMQMDNGYSDEAGALRALRYAEVDLPAVTMVVAEQWCAAATPEQLTIACAGEDRGMLVKAIGDRPVKVMVAADGTEVHVPERVSETLDYLFDVM